MEYRLLPNFDHTVKGSLGRLCGKLENALAKNGCRGTASEIEEKKRSESSFIGLLFSLKSVTMLQRG